MIIKRRQLLLATLIVALGAAVFVNWYYTKPTVDASGNTAATDAVSDDEKQGANLGDARYVISSDVTLDDAAAQAQASEYFASAKLRRKTGRSSFLPSFVFSEIRFINFLKKSFAFSIHLSQPLRALLTVSLFPLPPFECFRFRPMYNIQLFFV